MRLDKVNPTQDFIRQLCGIALAQLKDMQSQQGTIYDAPTVTGQGNYKQTTSAQSVLFGTAEGSIGQLQQIPRFTYMFLQRLQEVTEHHVRGVSRITSHSQRQVRFTGKVPTDSQNVIDGTLIEQFMTLDSKLQAKIVSNMMLN